MTPSNSTPTPWALVTGASAGIGAEFCHQLAARGYSIVLVARREDKLDEVAEKVRDKHGVECRCIPLDLALPDASVTLCAQLESLGIEVEFLVNNAGFGIIGSFEKVEWERHEQFLQVMLNSVCELTWLLLPGMQERGKGYIVNVASVAGLIPGAARNTLYGATKSFLVKFSESLAMENADTGVKVSALCPGFTYSEFHDVMNIREQVSQMPDWMWMEAAPVVEYGIESVMRDKPRLVAVPGKANRFIAMLMRKLPLTTTQRITQKQSKHWRK